MTISDVFYSKHPSEISNGAPGHQILNVTMPFSGIFKNDFRVKITTERNRASKFVENLKRCSQKILLNVDRATSRVAVRRITDRQ